MKSYIILFVFFIMIFTSCRSKEDMVVLSKEQEILTTSQNDEEESAPQRNDIKRIDYRFEVRSVTLSLKGGLSEYEIIYPYIIDLEYNMDNINKILYEAAIPKKYGSNNFIEFFEFSAFFEKTEIFYEITYISDDLISVIYSGDLVRGSSYADYDKTITIDIKNERVLSLKDFFEISDLQKIILELLETDKCKMSDGLSDNHMGYELKKTMKSNFLNNYSGKTDLERTDNFYLREGKVCLISNPFPSAKQNILAEFDIGETPQVKWSKE